MKKHTIKHILGAAGLLVVGGMTAIAINLPGSDAQAIDMGGTSLSVNVKESSTHLYQDGTAENGDPIIKAVTIDGICRLEYQATNIETGAELFHPPISQTLGLPHPADNTYYITLPFADYGALEGNYQILAVGYDCNVPEHEVDRAVLKMEYAGQPDVPHTGGGGAPNTGELTLFGVNLARADFVAIGLLILAAAIVCIVLAVRKKNHPASKRR